LADKVGLKIQEVPVTLSMLVFIGLLRSLLDPWNESSWLSVESHSGRYNFYFYLSVPGLLSIFAGLFFAALMFGIYSVNNYIVTNMALASISFSIIGILAVFASITLYSISRVSEKLAQKIP
jgi:hypothetical protein